MTLIAGFVCPDGFVIAGDTEVTFEPIRIQESKLIGSPGTDTAYRLVIGGAGDGAYLDEVMQEIRDKTSALRKPTIAQVDRLIRKTLNRIHDENIFKHWEPGDENRPSIDLIVGLRDAEGKRCIWKSENKAVSKVVSYAFVGSGSVIASHVSEKLFRDGMPTAIVHHLASHIQREAKAKGAFVGGNTDTWSILTKHAAPYFSISSTDQRYLWGLEEVLLSATRCALSGRVDAVTKRLAFLAQRLTELQKDAKKPLEAQGDQWHTIEIVRSESHPFGDF